MKHQTKVEIKMLCIHCNALKSIIYYQHLMMPHKTLFTTHVLVSCRVALRQRQEFCKTLHTDKAQCKRNFQCSSVCVCMCVLMFASSLPDLKADIRTAAVCTQWFNQKDSNRMLRQADGQKEKETHPDGIHKY